MITPEADKKLQALAGGPAPAGPAPRKRRPQPERDAPLRASRAVAGSNGAAPAPAAPRPTVRAAEENARMAAPTPAKATAGVNPEPAGSISASVAMAYRVVERNIKEGRDAAERLSGAGAPTLDAPTTKVAANRLLHMTRDLGTAWVDLVTAVVRDSDVRSLIERIAGNDAQPSQAARPPEAVVVQRISSRKPVEVSLSPLAESAVVPPPGLAGLHSLDVTAPPIASVRFLARAGGGLELHIAVPDQQPSGIYSGAIVDVRSQLPLGTLSVRVFE